MVINKYVGLCDHKHIYIHIYSNYNGDKSTLFTTSCRKNGSKKLVSNSLTTNKSKLLEDETTGFTPQPHEFPANVRLNQFLESTGLTNEYLNSSIWVSNGFPRSRWRQANQSYRFQPGSTHLRCNIHRRKLMELKTGMRMRMRMGDVAMMKMRKTMMRALACISMSLFMHADQPSKMEAVQG